MGCPEQKSLDVIFPPERADAFFDALYGGAEEGAYDIRLICNKVADNCAYLAFELKQRPGKCLRCSLTYGLPEVFKRHPLININGLAKQIGELLGWQGPVNWELGQTEEISPEEHIIPLKVSPA